MMIPGAGTPVADIPEPQDFTAIPAGKRLAIVTEGGMEDSSAKKEGKGIGESLSLKFQVIEGPNQGATIYERFNLVHENTATVEIAYRELGAFCRMIGLPTIPGDVQPFLNKPVVIDVGIEPGKTKVNGKWIVDSTKDPRNKIKGYAPASTWAHVQAAPAAPAAPAYTPPTAATQTTYTAPAAPTGGAAPWLRK